MYQTLRYNFYRKPTNYALGLLQENQGSNLIIDARNGFEDEEADVRWGFSELIPNMAKTSCTHCVMIMNEVNDIQGEMDMWTAEFSKYFTVIHTTTLESALEKLSESLKSQN